MWKSPEIEPDGPLEQDQRGWRETVQCPGSLDGRNSTVSVLRGAEGWSRIVLGLLRLTWDLLVYVRGGDRMARSAEISRFKLET
jgi:hypothetical protein